MAKKNDNREPFDIGYELCNSSIEHIRILTTDEIKVLNKILDLDGMEFGILILLNKKK